MKQIDPSKARESGEFAREMDSNLKELRKSNNNNNAIKLPSIEMLYCVYYAGSFACIINILFMCLFI